MSVNENKNPYAEGVSNDFFGKNFSGYVPNKFDVKFTFAKKTFSSLKEGNQKIDELKNIYGELGTNSFFFNYAIDLHVEKIQIVYPTLETASDIYMDEKSLWKPEYVKSVQTPIHIKITLVIEQYLKLLSILERIFSVNFTRPCKTHIIDYRGKDGIFDNAMHSSTFETTGLLGSESSAFDMLISAHIHGKYRNYDKKMIYSGCVIHKLDPFELDQSSRKFSKYNVDVLCNYPMVNSQSRLHNFEK